MMSLPRNDQPCSTEPCPTCLKSPALCQCADLRPIANKLFVLILQHPQEQDRELGTARLCTAQLVQSRLAVGLSWPNLAKALGRPLADPKRWGTLYLGAAREAAAAGRQPITVLDRAGNPIAGALGLGDLDGVIVLDGSWSQAKTLWWRNSWLLKTRRIALDIGIASRYGKLRREPRRESVSTLEAIAFLLSHLEGRPEIERQLIASFETLLQCYRARTHSALAPPR